MKHKFTQEQPSHGDGVALCGHGEEVHFYHHRAFMISVAGAGFGGRAYTWTILCPVCHAKVQAGAYLNDFARRFGTWYGNAPIVREDDETTRRESP